MVLVRRRAVNTRILFLAMDTADGPRTEVLTALLTNLQGVRPGDRALVALDGFDGVGKTYLARELVELSANVCRPLISLSIDGFHRPKAERIAAGHGADGFYRGSYRYDEFRTCVVDAVRAGRPITPAIWDVAHDAPVTPVLVDVPQDAIVLVDGIFLQRPELADVWDATVWVDAPFEVTVPRGNARFPGDPDTDPEAPVNQRYVGGQRLYLAEADPRSRSTWVFDNADLACPVLTGAGTAGGYQRIQARYVGRVGVEVGIFVAVDHLRRAGRLSEAEIETYLDIDDWFREHLPEPPFYSDGNSIGGVTWFKRPLPHTMTERIDRLLAILAAHAVEHDMVESDDPGEIVYEDCYQVGVVPHARQEQTPIPADVVLGPTSAGSKRGLPIPSAD